MNNNSNSFSVELKKLVIEELNLEDYSPEDIDDKAPLFGDEGLGLDSIDALELGIAIKKKFNINTDAQEEIKKHFYSIESLAAFLESQNVGA